MSTQTDRALRAAGITPSSAMVELAPLNRFRGDLWNTDRDTISEAARRILARRGMRLTEVFPLGSGLYVTVRLANGSLVTIGQDEIRREVWAS